MTQSVRDKKSPRSKQTYSKPALIRYGSLAELTQSGIYAGNDGNQTCVGNAGGNPLCGPPTS